MKRIIILMIGMMMVMSLSSAQISDVGVKPKVTTTYTPVSVTTCDANGRCNKLLFGGTSFGYEDNKWKPLSDLHSFKGTTNISCRVLSDGVHIAECLDYNATAVKVRLKPDNLALDTQVPVYIVKTEFVEDSKTDTTKEVEVKTLDITITFQVATNADVWFDMASDEVFHYGETSTTIQLIDDATENLEDGDARSYSPSTEWGLRNGFYSYTDASPLYHFYIMMKWNISGLPSGQTVTNALLGIHIFNNGLDNAGEYFNMSASNITPSYNVGGNPWDEGEGASSSGNICSGDDFCWNTAPSAGEIQSPEESSYYWTGSPKVDDQYVDWSVTNMVNAYYQTSESEITILLWTKQPYGGQGGGDVLQIYSAEGTYKPYLNITYEPAVSDSCTYSSGDWWIQCSDSCNITSSQDVGGNNIYFNGTGHINISGSIYNFALASAEIACLVDGGLG